MLARHAPELVAGIDRNTHKLEKIPGIGPLADSALVASIADANSFDDGGKSPAGWVLFRAKAPAAVKPHFWVWASGAMRIYASC